MKYLASESGHSSAQALSLTITLRFANGPGAVIKHGAQTLLNMGSC